MDQSLPHQTRATSMLVRMEGGIVWHRVGEGKTRIAINAFATLQAKRQWNTPCAMVVVCRRGAFFDWTEEFLRVGFGHYYIEEFYAPLPRWGKTVPTVWLVSTDMLHKVWQDIVNCNIAKFVAYDELYLYSNPAAKKSKAARKLTAALGSRACGLSGTIMPARDNTAIWGQCVAVGLHRRLARNLTAFRSAFQKSFLLQQGTAKFRDTVNKLGSDKRIMHRLKPVIDLHFPTNGRTLVEKVTTLPATKEQTELLAQLREEYYACLEGKEIEIQTAVELIIKAQQISDGWIKTDDGNFVSVPTNKVAALHQSVSELVAAGERVLILCAFKHDLTMLADALPFATLQMSGSVPFDIRAWQDGVFKVALATEASCVSVNHFSDVAYAKYFSMSFKWRELQQSMGRIDRKSSTHARCHYEFLTVKGSLDSHVLRTAKKSGSTEQDLIQSGEITTWLTQSQSTHNSKTGKLLSFSKGNARTGRDSVLPSIAHSTKSSRSLRKSYLPKNRSGALSK